MINCEQQRAPPATDKINKLFPYQSPFNHGYLTLEDHSPHKSTLHKYVHA